MTPNPSTSSHLWIMWVPTPPHHWRFSYACSGFRAYIFIYKRTDSPSFLYLLFTLNPIWTLWVLQLFGLIFTIITIMCIIAISVLLTLKISVLLTLKIITVVIATMITIAKIFVAKENPRLRVPNPLPKPSAMRRRGCDSSRPCAPSKPWLEAWSPGRSYIPYWV